MAGKGGGLGRPSLRKRHRNVRHRQASKTQCGKQREKAARDAPPGDRDGRGPQTRFFFAAKRREGHAGARAFPGMKLNSQTDCEGFPFGRRNKDGKVKCGRTYSRQK